MQAENHKSEHLSLLHERKCIEKFKNIGYNYKG